MKKKVMQEWVAALRSGEFKQGKYVLESNGNFCCLGVLCALASVKGYCIPVDSFIDSATLYDYSRGVLPPSVMKYSGIKSNGGQIESLGSELTAMNDNGKSFNEIADIIEKHYKEL